MFVRMLCLALLVVPAQPAGVEEFLIGQMRENRTPGMSYALVERDRVVASGAWGTDGFGEPMTPRTPVGFGSVSKPVTATAVLRLVDAGRVGLDDPVVEHVPWFRLADQRHAERITVRHLLHQTSGISPRDGFDRSDIEDNEPGAVRRWVESLADVSPNAAPGERHQYSPANAVILAALAEEVTGLSYADYLDREVFGPLDMADAIADADTAAESLPPGHEHYFGTIRATDPTFDESGVPYGYLAGSVTDLAHLAIPFTDSGNEVLSRDLVADITRGGPPAAGGRYGLGWRVGRLDATDTPIVWHAGASPGYHSVLIVAPDEGVAIAVQQNVWSPLADEQLNAAAFGAMAIALGGTARPPDGSSTETLLLVGLGLLVLVLAGAVAWSVRLAVRRARTGVPAAVGWSAFAIGSAYAVAVWLPGTAGLSLRHFLKFMPDVGQLAVAVVVLGSALVLARLVLLLRRGRAGTEEPSPPSNPHAPTARPHRDPRTGRRLLTDQRRHPRRVG